MSWQTPKRRDRKRQSTGRYVYQPLPVGYIRLVTDIHYGAAGNINAKLHNASQDSDPYYFALSYTWGRPIPAYSDDDDEARREKEARSAERDCYILVDGRRLAVTQNLVDYLEHHIDGFSTEGGSHPLWIDAICINQDDISEKNRLVARMHEIYQQAGSVRVWLGVYDRFSGDALEFIDKIARQQYWDFGRFKDIAESRELFEMGLGSITHSRKYWTALCRLLSRNWFSRCWVLQEAILARDMQAMVGSATIPFTWIFRAANFAASLQDNYFPGRNAVWNTWIISRWSNFDGVLDISSQNRLPSVLQLLRYFKATNPKDKVYSAFGWARIRSDQEGSEQQDMLAGEALAVDYSLPVEEIYTRVTKHIVEVEGSLELLLCWPARRRLLGLPSWVPDLSVSPPYPELLSRFGIGAARGSYPSPSLNPSPRYINVGGIHIGDISHVVRMRCLHNNGPERQLRKLALTVLLLNLIAWAGKKYDNGDPPLDMVWSALMSFHSPQSAPSALTRDGLVSWIERTIVYAMTSELDSRTEAMLNSCIEGIEHFPKGKLFTMDRINNLRASDYSSNTFHEVFDELEAVRESAGSEAFYMMSPDHIGCSVNTKVRPGDSIWVVQGLDHPLILRPTDQGRYETLGRCFTAGIMRGEAYDSEKVQLITLE